MRRSADEGKFRGDDSGLVTPAARAPWVFGGIWLISLVGSIFSGGPWAGFHAALFGCAGLLLIAFPPVVRLPAIWWVLAGLFVIGGFGAFLPSGWFSMPAWRGELESLGLETGSFVTIQPQMAAEGLAVFVLTLLIGLWLTGHRASPGQLRIWALAFTCGVAIFSILSRIMHQSVDGAGSYGFFPNRNHTATFLAMGSICGLGNILQASRDRRFLAMAVALCSTAVCLWAVAGWSISRGGVLLVGIGSVLWCGLLGRRYLGETGIKALALIALAGVGFFIIADSAVKERISVTVEKAEKIASTGGDEGEDLGQKDVSERFVDLRWPIALDTLEMIRDFKWTGVGAGQFYYVFPQYRHLSSTVNNAESVHPESDWLWMASETGLISTVALAFLVILSAVASLRSVWCGRDRALRCACLVAALIVPVHGIFDVPGHRISLALSAVFLLTLSMRSESRKTVSGPVTGWLMRGVGVLLMGSGVFLVLAGKAESPPLATIKGKNALERVAVLIAEDKELQAKAATEGREYQPDAAQDPLEKGLKIIADARVALPMDRNLLWQQALLAFHYDDKREVIEKSFALERALDPTWVGAPLRQSYAWIPADPGKAPALWEEALRRADKLEALQPNGRWSRENTLLRIRRSGRGISGLENWQP